MTTLPRYPMVGEISTLEARTEESLGKAECWFLFTDDGQIAKQHQQGTAGNRGPERKTAADAADSSFASRCLGPVVLRREVHQPLDPSAYKLIVAQTGQLAITVVSPVSEARKENGRCCGRFLFCVSVSGPCRFEARGAPTIGSERLRTIL